MKAESSKQLDRTILAIIIILIVLVLLLLLLNMGSQLMNYNNAIKSTLNSNDINHTAIITYTRAWDFAIVKTSSLFISLLIVLLGALYLLRVAESLFDFSAGTMGIRAVLSTTSPGLALAFLGVILAIFSLQYKTTIEYKYSDPTSIEAPDSSNEKKPTPIPW